MAANVLTRQDATHEYATLNVLKYINMALLMCWNHGTQKPIDQMWSDHHSTCINHSLFALTTMAHLWRPCNSACDRAQPFSMCSDHYGTCNSTFDRAHRRSPCNSPCDRPHRQSPCMCVLNTTAGQCNCICALSTTAHMLTAMAHSSC